MSQGWPVQMGQVIYKEKNEMSQGWPVQMGQVI
jgi:hypothetical protein